MSLYIFEGHAVMACSFFVLEMSSSGFVPVPRLTAALGVHLKCSEIMFSRVRTSKGESEDSKVRNRFLP